MTASSPSLQVALVAARPQSSALQLALRDWPDVDRQALLQTLEALGPDGSPQLVLIEAMRGGILAGAVLAQIVPGNAAVVWPPQLVEPQPLVTASMLLDELCSVLEDDAIAIVQSVVKAEALLDAEHMQAGGFSLLSDLLYLRWVAGVGSTTDASRADALPAALLKPLGDGDDREFAKLVERTYVETQDCPDLEGVRSTDEVLEAYRAVGNYRPELWFRIFDDQREAGCLIMAEHPELAQWELVYIGLVPEARGRGVATRALLDMQQFAVGLGCERIVAAVDTNNRPALKLYQSTNFSAWDRRSIYWKRLRNR